MAGGHIGMLRGVVEESYIGKLRFVARARGIHPMTAFRQLCEGAIDEAVEDIRRQSDASRPHQPQYSHFTRD